jgi:hypothetical protein
MKVEGVGLGLRWDFMDDVLGRLERGEEVGVDFFEIAPENYMRRGGSIPRALDRIARDVPLLTHGLTMDVGGLDPLDRAYFRELRAFVGNVGSPLHSDHLCFGGFDGALVHDLLPMPLTEEAAAHVAARARQAQELTGALFALENVTRYFIPGARDMDEADFFREVLDASGAGLLLDVNNAWVNAENDGADARDFLSRLPLDRVVQIHVAGHRTSLEDGVLIDTHGADVVSPVLDLLTWTIARTGAVPVVLERDHAIPPYDELLAELGRVRAAVDAGLAARDARAT